MNVNRSGADASPRCSDALPRCAETNQGVPRVFDGYIGMWVYWKTMGWVVMVIGDVGRSFISFDSENRLRDDVM